MKQCRSLRRAMRRGHYVNVMTGTYQSTKATKHFKEKLEALAKQAVEQTQTEKQNE